MARTVHTRRGGRRGERGAALLVVMVAVAILTALAVDVAYDNRVRLQIAGNGRDALRAEALAKSAVNLSRLVLTFQAQLDQSTQLLSQAASTFPNQGGRPSAPGTAPGATGAASATGGAAAQGFPRVQIWNVIPVNSGLVQALFGGGGGAAASPRGGATAQAAPTPTPTPPDGHAPIAEGGAKAAASFGDFDGAFEAKLEDEATKVNLQLDSLQSDGSLGLQVQAYLRLVCDAKWDAIFEREDASGQRVSRQELAVYLRDWVNDQAGSSALAASFPGGGNCNFVLQQNPFEQGFGDKNAAYDRGPERYRAKSARLDSVDELYLVAGVSDAFMAAFGDSVTVYLPKSAGRNVNSTRPEDEMLNALMMVEPTAVAMLADTTFPERLHKALMAARMGGFLTITASDFANVLVGLGVPVKGEVLHPAPNQKALFTDQSTVFRIRATGAVGDVEKRIDAVVKLDTQQPAQPQQTPPAQQVQQAVQQVQQQLQQSADAQAGKPFVGQRLIHWREE